jgi:3-methyladenine DNA glycosylase Tag
MRDKAATGIPPRIRACRKQPRAKRDDCYLELMSIATFKGGLNYDVVNAKWDAIREDFREFRVREVAAMTDKDVEAVETDPRVIHNKRKISSVVSNARTMEGLEREYGGVAEWLDSLPDPEARVKELHRRFMFMGPTTAYYFLHYAGEPIPPPHEWAIEHPDAVRGRRPRAGSRSPATHGAR